MTSELGPSRRKNESRELLVTPEVIHHYIQIAHQIRNEAIQNVVGQCIYALSWPWRYITAKVRRFPRH